MSDRSSVFYYVASIDDSGKGEPVDLTGRVSSFVFTDREGGLDKLSLTVNNSDLRNFDDPLFEYGGKMRVAFGNGRGAAPVRDMVIRKVTGGRDLTVELVTKQGAVLDTVKRRRRFENVSRSDVITEIAKENGFANPDIEDTSEVFESIAQGNLSDGQLMRKLANLEGFEFYIDFDGLHWHRRRVDQAPIREYIYFRDQAGGEILDFQIENDITRRPGKVTVKGRNPTTKEDIKAEASNAADGERDVLAGYSASMDFESGDIVDKKEIVHEVTVASNVETQEDAEREAKGRYRRAQQGAVKMALELRGDPSLVAKSIITISGMGKRVSGKYYVKEIVHSLDASGGYAMNAKLITDGFQGGKGKGKGSAEGGAAGLTNLATNLVATARGDMNAGVGFEDGDVQSDEFAQQLAVIKTAQSLGNVMVLLSKQEGDSLASNASKTAKALARLASAAKKVHMADTAASALEASALCHRLATAPEEIEAKGKKNEKPVNKSGVRAVEKIDEFGHKYTSYENTGGREK